MRWSYDRVTAFTMGLFFGVILTTMVIVWLSMVDWSII